MQTRDSPERVTELPPPPAPPARSANRWTISEGTRDGTPARPGRARHARTTPGGHPQPRRRRSLLAGLAGPLFVALAMGVFAFLRSRKGADFGDYRSLLIALAVIVFLIASRIGRRGDGGPGGRGTDREP
jgi:predicted lipid-binding transport protein (Tim44 family)